MISMILINTMQKYTIQNLRSIAKRNFSSWCLIIAVFLFPFGFDIIQAFIASKLDGDYWLANAVMYCLSACFFALSYAFRPRYK